MPEEPGRLQLAQDLSLGELERRCAAETKRFFARETNNPDFCFELFRRALVDNDQRAWELIYQQYHALVHGWALKHPGFSDLGTEAQDIVNDSFARCWKNSHGDHFFRFKGLASLLQYLKLCVHSSIVDRLRRRKLIQVNQDLRDMELGGGEGRSEVEEPLMSRLQRQEIWTYIQSCLKSESERVVIYENFSLDLKPAEKFDRHPDLFGTVEDVYRVKQNVLSRLARDDHLQNLGAD